MPCKRTGLLRRSRGRLAGGLNACLQTSQVPKLPVPLGMVCFLNKDLMLSLSLFIIIIYMRKIKIIGIVMGYCRKSQVAYISCNTQKRGSAL